MTSLYVSPTGSDSSNGSQSAPFATIQAASQIATPGTTVYVAPGTYSGGFETASNGTASAPITYVSTTPNAAIISGDGSGTGGTGWYVTGDYNTVKGFQITGPTDQIGIYGSGGAGDVIENNSVHDILTDPTTYQTFLNNHNGGAGIEFDDWGSGGYHTGGGNDTINANTVYNIGPSTSTDSLVQAVYMISSGTVSNNLIYNASGGGFSDWHGGSHETVVNNTIDGARDGGVVFGADPGNGGAADYNTVNNNIITNSNGAIGEGGVTGTHSIYSNNLVYNDGSNPISLQNGLQATNTVAANPMFVNGSGHDYQLQAGSPAIDAASATSAPATDFSGTSRPQGAGYDIGAYEAIAGGASSGGGSSGGGGTVSTDTLSLLLSEDAYKGNAHFIAKLDGSEIGSGYVTALHSKGQTEAFNYTGDWGSGTHNLEIDFTNDAHGRNPSQDRNLYVNQATYDGTAALASPLALYRNGAVHITVGHS